MSFGAHGSLPGHCKCGVLAKGTLLLLDAQIRSSQKLLEFLQWAWRAHLMKQVTKTRSTYVVTLLKHCVHLFSSGESRGVCNNLPGNMNDNNSPGNFFFLMAPNLWVLTSFSYCLCKWADAKGFPQTLLQPLGVVYGLPSAQPGPATCSAASWLPEIVFTASKPGFGSQPVHYASLI